MVFAFLIQILIWVEFCSERTEWCLLQIYVRLKTQSFYYWITWLIHCYQQDLPRETLHLNLYSSLLQNRWSFHALFDLAFWLPLFKAPLRLFSNYHVFCWIEWLIFLFVAWAVFLFHIFLFVDFNIFRNYQIIYINFIISCFSKSCRDMFLNVFWFSCWKWYWSCILWASVE